MGSEGTSRRRILDYLNDGEELGVEGPPGTPRAAAAARSLLPRFRWARMASIGRKCGGACGVKGRSPQQQPEVEAIATEIAVEKGDLMDTSGASASTSAVGGGETRPVELGVGLGLVFLLAKTSDEFNKMAKVRAEMETLLAEFKGHVIPTNIANAHKDVSRARNLESAASSCLTDGNELRVPNDRSEDHRRDHQVASCSGVGVEVEVQSRKRSMEDVLEEEFHAELERLHVNYGSETPPFPPEGMHDGAEPSDGDDIAADSRQGFGEDDDDDDHCHDDDDDDDDAARYRGISAVELERRLVHYRAGTPPFPPEEVRDGAEASDGDDIAADCRQGFEDDSEDDHDHGHDDDDDDEEGARYRGISAVELERRLHELLHQRNQERIEELEAALRRAERRFL